jgi:hypothetical protein
MAQVVSITPEIVKLSDFDLFWECYPRKKAKLDALKAWNQTKDVRPPIEEIIAALETMTKEYDWRSDPKGVFLPYPATWLRAGQWDDE